jgi:hypothetical protein
LLLPIRYSPLCLFTHFARQLSAQGRGLSQKPRLRRMSPLYVQTVGLPISRRYGMAAANPHRFGGRVNAWVREQGPEKFGSRRIAAF